MIKRKGLTKTNVIGVLALLGLLSTAAGLFESTHLVGKITEFSAYEAIKNGSNDQLAIVFFWHEDSPLSPKYEEIANEVALTNDQLFSIYQLDCEFFSEDEISICGGENAVSRLPIVKMYVPSKEKVNDITNKPNPAKEIQYTGAIDAKEMSMFAKKHMPNFAILRPTWKEIQSKILPDLSLGSALLFTNKQETAPLFKALSSIYRDRLRCIEIHSSQTDVAKHFQVEKYPMLVVARVNQDGQVEVVQYKDQLKMNKIREFLNKFALTDKVQSEGSSQEKQEKPQFQSAFGNDEEDEKQKLKRAQIQPLDYLKYAKKTQKEEGIVLIHVVENKEIQHPAFETLYGKLAQLSKYFELVVDSEEKLQFAKTVLGVTSFPSIKLLPFGVTKKSTQAANALVFKEKDTAESIIEEIDESTPDTTQTISDANMLQLAISQAMQEANNVQIYFHNKPRVPLTYRVISKEEKYVKAGVKFFTFRDPSKVILDQFQISSLPKVAILFKPQQQDQNAKPEEEGGIQASTYNGKMIYKDYTQFLEIFTRNFEEASDSQKNKKKVLEIKSQEDLITACKKTTRLCFIALLNGHPSLRPATHTDDEEEYDFEDYDETKATKLEQQVKTLVDVKNKLAHKPVNFAWIDALCHGNLLEELEIQEDTLPNYIMYNPSTKQFSSLVGRYEFSNLEEFSQKAIQGKTRLQTLSKELKVTHTNCVQQHEKLQKQREEYERQSAEVNDLDEEIKREILEEERIRKERIQAELKAERPKKKGKSKGNKKKQDL